MEKKKASASLSMSVSRIFIKIKKNLNIKKTNYFKSSYRRWNTND